VRPQILFPLFAPVSALPGVGPRNARLFEKIAGPRVVDLLWHLPSGLVDRRRMARVREAVAGEVVTLTLEVLGHVSAGNRRVPHRVRCADETGAIDLVYFHPRPDWLARTFPVGATRIVSGRIDVFQGMARMAHPDRVGAPEEREAIAVIEPVHPATAGLQPKIIARAVAAAVERAPDLPEWQDATWLARQAWPAWRQALTHAHAPAAERDLEPLSPPRARLAYDELLASQLALALVRRSLRRVPGREIRATGRLSARLEAALPFTLTGAQVAALAEIRADMASSFRMLRLLQGDVGSGKTIVALMAMLTAVEAGGQGALLAPTEILARQHHETIAPLAAAAGVRIGLLTGREKGRARDGLLEELAGGSLGILVGTHALLEEDVAFRDLALAVIDEQHRFGVDQRLELSRKGKGVDVLVMTATPIPRTLQLTAYGDMDVSRLAEKPAGRRPIDTRAVPLDRLEEVVAAVERQAAAGGRTYWVTPLVEETEGIDLAAATERRDALAARLGAGRVGLVHGRMKAREKDAAMEAFAAGRTQVLVATTVIEVGVDVPAATLMVIEHAERFGLAQLHQLRGRVGRGGSASVAILLYARPLGETARARLRMIRETDDGFRIAEEDLRLRGAGEVLGTRQSGLPAFRLADLEHHAGLLSAAADDVRLTLERDPDLKSPRGEALRILLYLFERDAAVGYLRSG
jgi:ATP-dependent DNA helicase RecG